MKKSQIKETLKNYDAKKGYSRRFFRFEPHVAELNAFIKEIQNEELSPDELFTLVKILKDKSGSNQSASTDTFKSLLNNLASFNGFGILNINNQLTRENVLLLINNKDQVDPDTLAYFIVKAAKQDLNPKLLIDLIGIHNLEELLTAEQAPRNTIASDSEDFSFDKLLNYRMMNLVLDRKKNDFVYLLNFLRERNLLTDDSLHSTQTLVAYFDSLHYQLALTLFTQLANAKLLNDLTLNQLSRHSLHFEEIAKACSLLENENLLTENHLDNLFSHPGQAISYAENQGCAERFQKKSTPV